MIINISFTSAWQSTPVNFARIRTLLFLKGDSRKGTQIVFYESSHLSNYFYQVFFFGYWYDANIVSLLVHIISIKFSISLASPGKLIHLNHCKIFYIILSYLYNLDSSSIANHSFYNAGNNNRTLKVRLLAFVRLQWFPRSRSHVVASWFRSTRKIQIKWF